MATLENSSVAPDIATVNEQKSSVAPDIGTVDQQNSLSTVADDITTKDKQPGNDDAQCPVVPSDGVAEPPENNGGPGLNSTSPTDAPPLVNVPSVVEEQGNTSCACACIKNN